jgi:hypothetical protein
MRACRFPHCQLIRVRNRSVGEHERRCLRAPTPRRTARVYVRLRAESIATQLSGLLASHEIGYLTFHLWRYQRNSLERVRVAANGAFYISPADAIICSFHSVYGNATKRMAFLIYKSEFKGMKSARNCGLAGLLFQDVQYVPLFRSQRSWPDSHLG